MARMRGARTTQKAGGERSWEKMAEDCKGDGKTTLRWILGEINCDYGKWMQLAQDLMSSDEFLVLIGGLYATHI
jgi:hypothetical protein